MSAESSSSGRSDTVKRWGYRQFGENHGVHGWLLPFAERPRDRIEELADISEFLTSRPPYCERVSHTHITTVVVGESGSGNQVADLKDICLWHGWWPVGSGSATGRHYGNPEYVHPSAQNYITGWEERREIAEAAASLGYVGPSQVGRMFGYDPESRMENTFSGAAWRMGLPWEELREAGYDRMARTWKTIYEWGYYQREIAAAFDVSQSVVSRALSRVEEFEPPADPTATQEVER